MRAPQGYHRGVGDIVARTAFTAWLVGLAVALVVGSVNGPDWLLEAGFWTCMGAAALLVVLCYGLGRALLLLGPMTLGFVALRWLLGAAGVGTGAVPAVVFGLAVAAVMRRIGPLRGA